MKTSWTNIIFVALLFLFLAVFQTSPAIGADPAIVDARHYSTVFGEVRNYRVFLPAGYFENPQKKYPVVYFLHGWAQRYFGNSGKEYSGSDFDKGEDNNGDNIYNFVTANQVIVVKPDGYNRAPQEEYYLRPYNVGPVEAFRQFPLYFEELVEHIDSRYHTIADRGHRGVCGLSMGGFMAYWIAGKYPDLFCAAGNFCGAVEYMVGPKEFPVEYRLLDYYKNYGGVNLRLHYGDKDYIRGYHEDMTRIWQQVMEEFEYKIYDGYHSATGLADMLTFMLKTFENPPPQPDRWDHIDVYPEFSIWNYQVSSDRIVPGVTIVENVDQRGFRCSVREFYPQGQLIPNVNVTITTAPLYEKSALYYIHDLDTRTLESSRYTLVSDKEGRLKISINGSSHEIGINKKNDPPNVCIASVEVDNMPWAIHNKDVTLSVKVLNKGFSDGNNVVATLSATKGSARITQSTVRFGRVPTNEILQGDISFTFQVPDESVEIERFKFILKDGHNEWVEYFEIRLINEAAEIKDFVIADGKVFTVANAGVDTQTLLLGNGNGDGVANPGESIVLLVKDKDKHWRTNLTFSDTCVNPNGVNIRYSDDWTEFDHVGASMKYDVPLISSGCTANHNIEFLAEYFLAEYPFHRKRKCRIKIAVNGSDKTAPVVRWVHVPGDNVVQAKIIDGASVESVRAKFILKADPRKSFEIELADTGVAGDRVEADDVFSKRIDEQGFGIYRVVIEAKDTFGNESIEEMPETYVLY